MATLLAPVAPLDPLWRLTVDQYHAMIDSGILPSGSPVELVEGVLLQKMPKKAPHRIATRSSRRALEAIVPAGWFVDEQEPITLEDSEPEPDVMVARGDSSDYPDRHPGAADVALVVEIADATILRDRGVKMRMYARAGIANYWIVDLNTSRVEVRTSPEGDGYRVETIYSRHDAIPTQWGMIAVADLLPKS
jgi:Uma2 family endonuclease